MRKRDGFTLIELLVVVTILGLLLAMLMPVLGRAKDLAEKAVCAAQINAYGKQMMLYVKEYNSYPPMGDNRFPAGWPKFYGVLHQIPIAMDTRRRGMYDYSVWEADEVWEKCFCPSMNEVKILKAADDALTAGENPVYKPALHRAAAGYQWNVTLRAAGPGTQAYPSGRWPRACTHPPGGFDNTLWIDYFLYPPGTWCICQAVHPDELHQPAKTAEAWDSFDFETLPNFSVAQGVWDVENLIPGWHVGPQSKYGNGYALLNGARHPESPNILYADGHVSANATKELTASDLGNPPASCGTFQDCLLNSWDDWDDDFGTMHYIVPDPTAGLP